MPTEPLFLSDGEVDPISHEPLPPPRISRQEPALTFGQMLSMVVTVGIVLYGAGYLVWQWLHS